MLLESLINLLPTSLPLIFAMMMGIITSLIYLASHNTCDDYIKSFMFTISATTLIMAAVCLTIGSNIAASLGLFGILSILRFRSSVRNIKDMSYLLLAVTLGLSSGYSNYGLSFLLLISFALALFIHKFISKSSTINHYILIMDAQETLNSQIVFDLLNDKHIEYKVKSLTSSSQDKKWELVVEVSAKTNAKLMSIIELAKNLDGLNSVSLTTPYFEVDS